MIKEMTDKEYVETKLQVEDLLDEGYKNVKTYSYYNTFVKISFNKYDNLILVKTFQLDENYNGYYMRDPYLYETIKNRKLQ